MYIGSTFAALILKKPRADITPKWDIHILALDFINEMQSIYVFGAAKKKGVKFRGDLKKSNKSILHFFVITRKGF